MEYQYLIAKYPKLFSNKNAIIKIVTDKEKIQKWVSETQIDIGIVYKDPYIMIIRDLVKFPSGKLGTYFRLINTAFFKGGQASAILPEINGKLILLNQFRHPTRSYHLEIPRGFGEPNLTAEMNARKEIEEEIQGDIESIFDLGIIHNNTGIEGNEVKLYFAKLKSFGKPKKDEGINEIRQLIPKEFEELIKDGTITDGFTIAAYTRAKLNNYI